MTRPIITGVLTGMLLIVLGIVEARETDIGKGKKIIEFGWDIPNTRFLREHSVDMERRPFDGVVLSAHYTKEGQSRPLEWTGFGRERLTPALFEECIADLKATPFSRFTDNFLRFNVTPGDIGWFEDWSPILNNVGIAARIAQEGGLKGIFFDVEQYGGSLFRYPQGARRDFQAYAQQAKTRGEEFIRAINRMYPDITLLLTFGVHAVQREMAEGKALSETNYGLLPAFLDGILSACTPETEIVDGFEFSYPYKSEIQFLQAYHTVKNRGIELTSVPDRYRAILQVGFGLWMDYSSKGIGWHVDDFSRNYFAPNEFRDALFHALRTSDEYVWVYSQMPNWWTDKDLPQEYVEALIQSREDHNLLPGYTRETVKWTDIRSAKEWSGYDDQETFGDLWEDYEEIVQIPMVWKFRTDPKDRGTREKWYALRLDDNPPWKDIEIGEWWEPQGYLYDGTAWYRVWVSIPKMPEGHRLYLYFGAVDEAARVYVNGSFAGAHDVGEAGWDQRFRIEVTDLIRPGSQNLIAVRVYGGILYGGIWKSVKLMMSK